MSSLPPDPSHKTWKISAIILVSAVVVFSLFAWYGFHLDKQDKILLNNSQNNNQQNNNMTQTTLQEGEIIWKEGQAHVVVDISENAYTVFMFLPLETNEQKARDLFQKNKANGSKFSVMPMDQFVVGIAQNVEAKIIKNEYPEVDVVKGVLEFLKKVPGTPIGLTWNGGIAFTYNDYTYTKKTYDEYLKNHTGNFRPADRNADPVHPLNHFGPLLGW